MLGALRGGEKIMTGLEVLDTAVKVGLGALIAGFTNYLVTARRNKDEATKALAAEKLALLKECALKMEEAKSIGNKALQNIYLIRDHNKNDIVLEDEINRFAEATYKAREARTLIQMLGASDLVGFIDEYIDKLSRQFNHIKEYGLEINYASINEITSQMDEISYKIGIVYSRVFNGIYT